MSIFHLLLIAVYLAAGFEVFILDPPRRGKDTGVKIHYYGREK